LKRVRDKARTIAAASGHSSTNDGSEKQSVWLASAEETTGAIGGFH
jgi:hypothetical protein